MQDVTILREKLKKTKKKMKLKNIDIALDMGVSESFVSDILKARRNNVLDRLYFKLNNWLLSKSM